MSNRVLLVEDDDVQRHLSQALLSREGLTVTAVADGAQAEREILANRFDLILLDINIPYKNGFEICTLVKRNHELRLTPVILMTGMGDIGSRLRGFEVEADDFLTKPIDRLELKARIRSLLKRKQFTDELERAERVLMALGESIEARDPLTQGHCKRISQLSVLFGRNLGLCERQLKALEIAGCVHDIGKVAVPDAILMKRGPLLPHEWTIMCAHPVIGERICLPLRSMDLVSSIIRHHHEKQDGSGYPDGLKGSDIPMLARVMQIVDVFDALTSDRSYRSALSISEALDIMRDEVERGWWDGELFNHFITLTEGDDFCAHVAETAKAHAR